MGGDEEDAKNTDVGLPMGNIFLNLRLQIW
jgi:hypothetical protein